MTAERPWATYFVVGHLTNYGVPVFHDYGGMRWRTPDGVEHDRWYVALAEALGITQAEARNRTGTDVLDALFRARCGVVLEQQRANRRYMDRQYAAMRVDLAERIGRPCRRCWPEGLPA